MFSVYGSKSRPPLICQLQPKSIHLHHITVRCTRWELNDDFNQSWHFFQLRRWLISAAKSLCPEMFFRDWKVGVLVCHFGSHWNISTTTGWIVVTFCTDLMMQYCLWSPDFLSFTTSRLTCLPFSEIVYSTGYRDPRCQEDNDCHVPPSFLHQQQIQASFM